MSICKDDLQAIAKRIADLNRSRDYASSVPQIRKLQTNLAKNFGEIYGWKLSSTPVALNQLSCGRRNRTINDCIGSQDSWLIDHAYAYRIGRNPVAIAAHLYGVDMERMTEAATRLNLSVEIIKEYPSWWFPGSTTLVLWTRKES